jgi:hypothetical protein
MAKRQPKSSKASTAKRTKQKHLHPGGSAEEAKAVGGKLDFGAPEKDRIERTYTSANTKRSDPGGAVLRAGSDESRISGVGGHESGPGSSSGGDLDPDIVGLGGGGIAASGKIHEPPGPDDATGTSRDFASGPPARGDNQTAAEHPIKGSTVQYPDETTIGPEGADSASHAEGEDDAFAGEVSSDEASGRNDEGG